MDTHKITIIKVKNNTTPFTINDTDGAKYYILNSRLLINNENACCISLECQLQGEASDDSETPVLCIYPITSGQMVDKLDRWENSNYIAKYNGDVWYIYDDNITGLLHDLVGTKHNNS